LELLQAQDHLLLDLHSNDLENRGHNNNDPDNNGREIIHLELPVVQDRHVRLVNQVDNVDQCLDHVQVLFVPVLLHDHRDLIKELINAELDAPANLLLDKVHQVHVRKVQVLIDLNQVAHNDQADLVDQVALDNVPALVAHLEKVAERRRVIRVRKRSAKRSTIWKRPQLVAQLFLEAMEIRRYDYVEELR
jgi:hypothetical protein